MMRKLSHREVISAVSDWTERRGWAQFQNQVSVTPELAFSLWQQSAPSGLERASAKSPLPCGHLGNILGHVWISLGSASGLIALCWTPALETTVWLTVSFSRQKFQQGLPYLQLWAHLCYLFTLGKLLNLLQPQRSNPESENNRI